MSFSYACSQRRSNYEKLFNALSKIPTARPLYEHLPEGIYPQVFPMVMDAPEAVFDALKRKGVPIIRFGEYRWSGVDESTCPISADLSRRVFQFSCHQSLTAKEVDGLIDTIRSVIE
jgi:dTDP-4-amino-4,6-dideoxygalactose transaminase